MRPTPLATATTLVVSSLGLAFGASPASASTGVPVDRDALTPLARGTIPTAATPSAAYTIASGDTISGVAQRFGLRTADVLAWNGLDWSSVIHPGQVVVLTAPAPPAPAAPAPAAPAPAATHTVVGGDTLWAIARGGGVSLAALLDANGLVASSIIYPGQLLVIPSSAPTVERAAVVAPAPATATPTEVVLDAEQVANARIIIEVGRSRGVPDRGIAIALATAMVESWIRNLDWGDRDSLGLFQQRPSTGWGTDVEVRDAYRAAAAFFGGPDDPNGPLTRGLLDVAGWESMGFGEAAQAVQVSAYPDRYAPWEQQSYAWLAALG